jgi:3-hydroxyacyl-[acyl-carrier-protein] dehydratase
MSLDAIKAAIPHREPFLLVDEIVERTDERIVCRKTFAGDEFWYQGHYPEFPLTPGVLLVEAAMQAGAVLLAEKVLAEKVSGTVSPADATGKVPVATRINNVKFRQMVRPGDTIEMEVDLADRVTDVYFLRAKVTVAAKTAVTFDFACKMAAPEQKD